MNLFRYVNNTPTNFTDPTGQFVTWIDVFVWLVFIYGFYAITQGPLNISKRGPGMEKCLKDGDCSDIPDGAKDWLCTQLPPGVCESMPKNPDQCPIKK